MDGSIVRVKCLAEDPADDVIVEGWVYGNRQEFTGAHVILEADPDAPYDELYAHESKAAMTEAGSERPTQYIVETLSEDEAEYDHDIEV